MIIENELVYDKGALDDSRSHLDALVVHLLVELLENTFFPSPRGRARRAHAVQLRPDLMHVMAGISDKGRPLEDLKRCMNLSSKPVANLNEIEQFLEFVPGNR